MRLGSMTWLGHLCRRPPASAVGIDRTPLAARHERDRRARNYADGPYMSTAAVGVTWDKPTAHLGRRGPSAYLGIARRLYYADGLDMAVGIAQTRPTGAVGIDMTVGIVPCSGSVQTALKAPSFPDLATTPPTLILTIPLGGGIHLGLDRIGVAVYMTVGFSGLHSSSSCRYFMMKLCVCCGLRNIFS